MARVKRCRVNRVAQCNHPIYAAGLSKEHPLLEDLMAADPGSPSYMADLKRELELPKPLCPANGD